MTTGSRRCRSGADAGAALVELAVAMPVLVALVIGTADFARVFYTAIELSNAARAGVQYGAKNLPSSSDTSGMEAAARSAVSADMTGVTAVASPTLCQCATAAGLAFITVACTTPPATACPSPEFRVITVTVTASKTFTTISPYPGIPHTLPLTRMATMRVTE